MNRDDIARMKRELFDVFKEIVERLENVERFCKGLQIDMQEYMDKSPKPDDQWTEERLRALELKTKTLESKFKKFQEDIL